MAGLASVLYRLLKIVTWIVVCPLALVCGPLLLLLTGLNWCLFVAEGWAEGKTDEPPFLWMLSALLCEDCLNELD